jgi:hypothetical protein
MHEKYKELSPDQSRMIKRMWLDTQDSKGGTFWENFRMRFSNYDDIQKAWKVNNQSLYFGDLDVSYVMPDYSQRGSRVLSDYHIAYVDQIERVKTAVCTSDLGRVQMPMSYAVLIRDYARDNGFRNYLTFHYNPRENKLYLHPGQTRLPLSEILSESPTLKCYFFNTLGFYDSELMQNFQEQDITDDSYQEKYFDFTADHGTLIPTVWEPGYNNSYNKYGSQREEELVDFKKFFIDQNNKVFIQDFQSIAKKVANSAQELKYLTELYDYYGCDNVSEAAVVANVTPERLYLIRGLIIALSRCDYQDKEVKVALT